MSVLRMTRQVREVWEVPRDLLLRRYPPFVTGGPLPRGHVPVFVFHSVEPESFARKLQYLADNDYRTLTAQEYLDVLTRGATPPERAVVLTFDDGRASLASVGAPLLQKHGMTGIVFLVPGRTPATSSSAGVPETALLTWDQVGTLAASGTFDFQSHTLHHSRVHVAPRVAGFMTPWMRSGYPAFDVPLVERDGRDLLAHDVPLGTPLLESAPRTSEARRFHEDPSPRQACVEAVAAGGGEAFFERPGWERELRRIAAGGARGWGGRLETDADRENAIRRELALARELIERHTGRPVVHLCYPWHASGPTARRLAREAGYVTAFSGKVPGVPLTAPGGDPQSIARIGEDYVELLPGRGRARLLSVLRRKWSRRLGGGT